MHPKHQSVFWQTIAIMMTALALLLVSLSVLIGYMNVHQKESNREYFRMEVQSRVDHIEERLYQLKITAAQMTRIDALQMFFREEDLLRKWEYHKVMTNLQKVFVSQENLVASMDIFRPDGERYIALQVDYVLSGAVQENYDLDNPDCDETKFILIRQNKDTPYASFGFITPLYSIYDEGRLGTLALFGLTRQLAEGNEHIGVYLRDADGRCYPDGLPEQWDARVELSYGLTAYFVQKSEYIDASESFYYTVLIVMAAISLITLLTTGFVLLRQLTHPVMKMRRQMEQIKSGTLELVTIDHGGVELRDLSDDINGMLMTIERRNRENVQIHDKLYQAELARVQAQLYALRSQINPHFLYNTLQMVCGMAVCHNAPEIARAAAGMAHIFRYSIKEEALAESSEEIATVHRYMEIMNMRQGDRFRYEESVEEGLEHCMIPRMIVQPVVENSIKYGFEAGGVSPVIRVRWKRDGEDVIVTVQDNGSGIPEERMRELKERMQRPFSPEKSPGSIGLHNIHQRLFLRYGDGYGVTLFSPEEGGTSVVLRMKYVSSASEFSGE